MFEVHLDLPINYIAPHLRTKPLYNIEKKCPSQEVPEAIRITIYS